jgi:large subunit ribosomal protein L29
MKTDQIKELHQLTVDQLQERLQGLEKELVKSRLERSAQKLEDTSKPDRLRKDVARIKTIIREKQLKQLIETPKKNSK